MTSGEEFSAAGFTVRAVGARHAFVYDGLPDCANLGYMRSKGRGIPQDDTLATELYRRGCDMGSAWGCHNLGYRYEKG